MGDKKKVLIVDDHPLYREGLKNAIARMEKFEVIGEAGKALEAFKVAMEIEPDLVLVDVTLPDQSGIELTKTLRKSFPDTGLLIMCCHSAANCVADSFAAGAAGYVVKDSGPETLMHALEIVSEGGYFLDGPISDEAVQRLKGLTAGGVQAGRARYDSLTRRQQEVMNLLVQGSSYKAIATELNISPRTVEGHRNEIMKVLELTNTVELTRYAMRLGLIESCEREV
jgi:DNA-binding NarL/FixJ family response regulator